MHMLISQKRHRCPQGKAVVRGESILPSELHCNDKGHMSMEIMRGTQPTVAQIFGKLHLCFRQMGMFPKDSMCELLVSSPLDILLCFQGRGPALKEGILCSKLHQHTLGNSNSTITLLCDMLLRLQHKDIVPRRSIQGKGQVNTTRWRVQRRLVKSHC